MERDILRDEERKSKEKEEKIGKEKGIEKMGKKKRRNSLIRIRSRMKEEEGRKRKRKIEEMDEWIFRIENDLEIMRKERKIIFDKKRSKGEEMIVVEIEEED